MDQYKRRKHNADKRALVVCVAHRTFFDASEGGAKNVVKLERSVALVETQFLAQENCRIEMRAAIERCRKARGTLRKGMKHVARVSTQVTPGNGVSTVLDAPPVTNDDDLLARSDAIHAAASAEADVFAKEGVQPGLLDTLAGEIAALRKAKAAATLAGKRFTESMEALDRALADGDDAIAVLEGLLVTSPDAPVGALTAFRAAKRIGPRVAEDDQPVEATPAPTAEPPTVPNKVA